MANTTLEVGKKLVELCRQNKNVEAVDALYAAEIQCIEATAMPHMPKEMKGIKDVRKKNVEWVQNHEIHSSELMGPFPNGDRFIVHAKYDVSPKAGPMAGKRMQLEEGCLYTVKDGKIVKEEFFYDM
jgi:hypothetical protein